MITEITSARFFFALAAMATAASIATADPNAKNTGSVFNFDWRFAKGNQEAASQPSFDDSAWQRVDLPHDWAISGPFGKLTDDGNTGKLPWRGEGWYRKHFDLPADAQGKRLQFIFDGVMASPTVYLNGKKVGSWIYGYNSFWLDATDAALFGKKNVLAVHADTTSHGSRWYPGAGIYRKVTLRLVEPVHIPVWGVAVAAPEISATNATVQIQVEVTNATESDQHPTLETILLDPNGKEAARAATKTDVAAGRTGTASIALRVSQPLLWDTETPRLYTAVTRLVAGGRELQRVETPFGIRTFEFTANDGFHLNGRRVQLYGVDLHHDHGPLGAAFFPRAMERQLQIMKDMGVNALRTSHNPPAPEVLDLCDRMGIVVWDELFDKYGSTAGVKCSTDEFVARYAEREVENFVRRDRNHPSVLLWSIGNEIGDLKKEHVTAMAGYIKKQDRTRPTTLASHIPNQAAKHLLDDLDTSGWNYGQKYMTAHEAYPHMPLLYSESASAFGTRGAYRIQLPTKKDDYGDTGEINAYMLNAAQWSDIPEHEFERMRKHTFVAGEFVWTGFDYLGEPTPFSGGKRGSQRKDGAQARSSYFGIVDLAGLPKDSYYNYRSRWNPRAVTVHLAPHWNWEGSEAQPIPVFVYTNGDEAELFLNGQSLGRKKKLDPDAIKTAGKASSYYDIIDAYRIRWMEVPYRPGELKAVAYKKGQPIGDAVTRTAGPPARLRLSTDRSVLTADGFDLCYVTIEMTDKDGTLCPKAMDKLTFSVAGAARLAGVDNGDSMGHDSFTDSTHPLFYGKAVAVLRSIPGKSGLATLKAESANGLKSTIDVQLK